MCFFYPKIMQPLDKYCDMRQCAAFYTDASTVSHDSCSSTEKHLSSSWSNADFKEGLRLVSEMCFVCVLLKETGEEAQGDAEQHEAGDDGDGELHGQELRWAGHQLRRGHFIHGHTQPQRTPWVSEHHTTGHQKPYKPWSVQTLKNTESGALFCSEQTTEMSKKVS